MEQIVTLMVRTFINSKQTGLNEYVYDFYVAVDDILDIHNYLMKRNDTVYSNAWVYEKAFFTGLSFLSTLTSVNSLSNQE